MKAHSKLDRPSRRRGIVIPYIAVAGVVLVGFCGLAVDLARVQAAKTELRRAADSAARAGADELLATRILGNSNVSQQTSMVTTVIEGVMANSQVDGTYLFNMKSLTGVFNPSTGIVFGYWNSTAKPPTFTAGEQIPVSAGYNTTHGYNAVEVIVGHTTANGNPIPLLFTAALGRRTLDVSTYATAAYIDLLPTGTASNEVSTQTVQGNYNPYLAGAPAWSYKSNSKGSYASAPEEAVNDYNNTAGSPNLDQDTNAQEKRDHPLQYDLADPNNVGGDVAGTTDPSESPLQVRTNGGQDIPISAGEIIQVTVPDTANNMVANDQTGTSNQANGELSGDTGVSAVYEDVGAIDQQADPTAWSLYPAYSTDPQANYTENPTTATTTNISTNSQYNDVIPGTENNLTNVAAPLNSMMGVFLGGNDGTAPVNQGANTPPGYDFTSQQNRDYSSIAPGVQQVFFAGTGTNTTGLTQNIVVPAGATRFYLGTMDGQEWANNVGSFSGITIGIYRVELVQ